MTEATTTDTTLYCYVHPTRPTLLRCNSCERPICVSCAVRTPTGYRCKECVRGQQKIFDTALWYDYVIVFFTGAFLSAIASLIALVITSIIWGIFVIVLGPLAGAVMGNIARRLVKNRRSNALNIMFAVGIIMGTLPMLLVLGLGGLLVMLSGGADVLGGIMSLAPLLWQFAYLVTALPSAYSQFSGIFIKR
jgi:MFS family permease